MANVFVQDTFTGVAGTNLSAHTGEIGATWAKDGGAAWDDLVLTGANSLREGVSSGISGRYYASGLPTTNEYDVEIDVICKSDPETDACDCFVQARINTVTGDCYLAGYIGSGGVGTGKWTIDHSGSLGDFAQTLTPGNTYHLKFQVRNAAKKVFIDGVERISTTDDTLTAAGRAGVGLYSGAGPTDSTGLHADNFVATTATTAFNLVRP